jgi:hypothetical protein
MKTKHTYRCAAAVAWSVERGACCVRWLAGFAAADELAARDTQALYEGMASLDEELPWPQPGAMSFMMSKDGYLGDAKGHWHSHLMFHVPKTEGASWGANLPDSPVLLYDAHRKVPEPETIFLVPAAHWSDGTAAPIP